MLRVKRKILPIINLTVMVLLLVFIVSAAFIACLFAAVLISRKLKAGKYWEGQKASTVGIHGG